MSSSALQRDPLYTQLLHVQNESIHFQKTSSKLACENRTISTLMRYTSVKGEPLRVSFFMSANRNP